MLFRQRPVEKQQVGPVVDRRGGMLRRQPQAAVAPRAVGVGIQDAERRPLPAHRFGQSGQPLDRSVGCRDAEIRLFRPVEGESPAAAMSKEILQLDGAAPADAPFAQCGVERTVAAGEFGFHEDLPHDGVYEGRMHAVSAEISRAGQPAAQPFDIAAAPDPVSFGQIHRLSIPASRPVEKAIWRL